MEAVGEDVLVELDFIDREEGECAEDKKAAHSMENENDKVTSSGIYTEKNKNSDLETKKFLGMDYETFIQAKGLQGMKEHGSFMMVTNIMFEILCMVKLTGSEYSIISYIIRHTVGNRNKGGSNGGKCCQVTVKAISDFNDIALSQVYKGLQSLVDRGMIILKSIEDSNKKHIELNWIDKWSLSDKAREYYEGWYRDFQEKHLVK